MRGRTSSLFLALLMMGSWAAAYVEGPPAQRTGGFGERTCWDSGCHASAIALNAGPGVLQIQGVPTSYESGKTYTIMVTLQQTGQRRWGFQIAARKSSDGTQAGTLSVADPAVTQTNIENGVSYLEHRRAGTFLGMLNGPVTWSMSWTAPETSSGTVSFHAAGNAANGDGNNTGDFIYTTSATANPATETAGVPYALSALGSKRLTSSGAGSPVQVGYAKVAPDSGQSAPVGTAVFGLTQNNLLVTEAGVPSSPLTTLARSFVQFQQNAVDTGVAIANPASMATSLMLTLTDSQGRPVAGGEKTIPLEAGQQTAQFVSQLFQGISIPATGTLAIASSQPVSIVALRQSTNTRQPPEALLTTLPVADLTTPTGTEALFLPQVADGGGFATQLMLLNTTAATETGIVRFFDGNGAELAVQAGGVAQSSFAYSIPAGGVFVLKTDGAGSLKVGSARVIPGPGQNVPAGSAIFSLTQGGTLVTEAAVPASPRTPTFSIFVDHKTAVTGTGLAIANSGIVPANLTLQLFDTDGNPALSPASLSVPANGHVARFVDQLFPELPPSFTGTLKVTSDQVVAAVTLRQVNNTRNVLLTTLPVADLAAPPSREPLFFPQIADGGGFTTQIILLNPSGGSQAGQLVLTRNDGTALAISLQ